MNRRVFLILILLAFSMALQAQEIATAEQFFAKVSDRYAEIYDYEAAIQISSSGQIMRGKLSFKSPSLLRIDFTQPADQVIVFDGERLVVYIPQYRAVLQQETGAAGLGAASVALASREGLSMMKRNYTIAWEKSPPQPEALDEGSNEMVYRLLLTRKTVSEGFKTVRISVSETSLLMLRLEGWTVANEKISFDLSSMKLNQNIPATRFLYDAPASANVYNNFLFQ
ncbi:MAG: outer-membrane lipoprotein carrier protein LolA [Spirochaetia bacterium]|jgi:outer membrane lipoprotein-sorting protein|nr:outer-membrane lipoprotein carrier protein LolA [Spirochaetia bacterium]